MTMREMLELSKDVNHKLDEGDDSEEDYDDYGEEDRYKVFFGKLQVSLSLFCSYPYAPLLSLLAFSRLSTMTTFSFRLVFK
jgi:hypothetical protein